MECCETSEPSPDELRLTVDGVVFDVRYDLSQPGAYHYTRVTDPAAGYGFTSRMSTRTRRSTDAHVAAIRGFLEMVDPVTGYIEDDDEDDQSDD